MFKKLSPKKNIDKLIAKSSELIRDRAIAKAKAKIAANGKDIANFTEEQLEIIVAEEEYQIKSNIKKSTFMSVLAFFGIAYF